MEPSILNNLPTIEHKTMANEEAITQLPDVHEYVMCDCGDIRCTIVIYATGGEPDVDIEFINIRRGFWRRIQYAFKYVFTGYTLYLGSIVTTRARFKEIANKL